VVLGGLLGNPPNHLFRPSPTLLGPNPLPPRRPG
jgi:hypothetical protein